ncbi:MAG: hypothetical protein K2L51_07360 [Clostridiales bacterium]|nr:hypothetical protein [Clostridiales bacterium]
MQRKTKIRSTVPVFYAADNARMPYLSVSLISLLQNASPAYRYEVHILHAGLSEEYAAPVRALATPHCAISFTNVSPYIAALADSLQESVCRAGALAYCMFIPDLFPQYGKAVVLGAQTVVEGDVSALYRTELQDALVAAVADEWASTPDSASALAVAPDRYFNAGVLVLNLRAMREENLYAAHIRLLADSRFAATEHNFPNALCGNRVAPLSADWNVIPAEEESENAPQIVHYRADRVPWRYDGILYGGYFWRYAHLSPFLGEILGERIRFASARAKTDTPFVTDIRARSAFLPAL